MNEETINLKKIIRYRLSHSGTKETDILYHKMISNKLDNLSKEELFLLSNLFKDISDIEMFNILTNKSIKPLKYKDLLIKIINE